MLLNILPTKPGVTGSAANCIAFYCVMQSGDTRNCVGFWHRISPTRIYKLILAYLFTYLNIRVREFVNIYMNIMQRNGEACMTSVLYDMAACRGWRVVTSVNAQ